MSWKERALAFVTLAILAGCERAGNMEPDSIRASVVPVSGKLVNADGQPVGNALITLHAKEKPGNDAFATTESDGSFRVGTFGKDDGACPGNYVVTVEPSPNAKSKPAIPRKYLAETTSSLTFEVKAGGGPANFTLK